MTDEEFEATIEEYHRQTYQFRQMLENRSEEEIQRDDYVLDQHSKGKRMKVVLRKASKKLKMPELAPESPDYTSWLEYYDTYIQIILGDLQIKTFYENKQKIAGIEEEIARKENVLKELKQSKGN